MSGGRPVAVIDADYSPDVELNAAGQVVFARHIPEGETVHIPRHLWERLVASARELPTADL